MEHTQAFPITASKAKIQSARAGVVNVLDALSPACAPFAVRWDAEADRRKALRTSENLKALLKAQKEHNSARSTAAQAKNHRQAARSASNNPLSTARRAARTADKGARQQKRQAKGDLTAAKASYPATLRARAVQAHAIHAVPGALASWVMSTPQDWTVWPASVSASLIGLNAAALWLGRRQVSVRVEDGLTAEERRLVERLDPSYWVQHAPERGLEGTVTTPAEVTSGGITCDVRLDGKWTAGKLRDSADHVRALLGCRSGLRMEIKAGKRGGWAVIILRTRSAADGDDLKWSPTARTFGVDTVTGEQVTVPLGERMLIAGRSGAGKSVASRPLLYDASEGETNALVIIDLKKVEGRLWDHRARVASAPVDVIDLVDEVVAEMMWRLDKLPKGQATWTPSREHPRLTLVVDEGAEVVSTCSDLPVVVGVTENGREIKEKRSALDGLESIARMGRAACVDMIWMTQKPTIGDGIPKQIAPQMGTRICLAVSTPAEARVVLGEDAQAKGWNADELPVPGVAFVRDGKRKPNPVRVRFMDDKAVIGLADRPIWHRSGVAPVIDMRKPPTPPSPPTATAEGTEERVLRVVGQGPARQKDIAEQSGLPKGTVSKVVARLVDAGHLARLDDGTVAAK